jgi:hypothetical protein
MSVLAAGLVDGVEGGDRTADATHLEGKKPQIVLGEPRITSSTRSEREGDGRLRSKRTETPAPADRFVPAQTADRRAFYTARLCSRLD